ncbi:MAG: cobyrinate a,c-diamide synthase [Desulfovibrio sp.]|nr:cobyrinate a,c-diamide synthase [Desulfovibrio sp.]MBI4961060.1 cobyrinate a,c-diamide synthase [Desulfovibrio sp.]
MTKSLLVSGTHSGCGKTSLTLGLLAAFSRRGLRVAPFKTGPDFIDPGLHALACGRKSHNLDSWMLSEDANQALFARYAAQSDVAVLEGVMGLFDGASGVGEQGSAAHMAKLLGISVVLVIDASGMARSAAAVAQGFAGFDPDLNLAGVVFNRVGGPGHRSILSEAMELAKIPVLGFLPKDLELAVPSRHLGLVTAQDLGERPQWMERLADWVETAVDLDSLLKALPETAVGASVEEASTAPRVRLGVARDRAFCFAYEENLRLLESAGAELVFFSPLTDARLPGRIDGLYLPGGYPELHASALSENAAMLADIREFSLSGLPVYGECGGFMALMESIEDIGGRVWPMVGVFPCRARMGERFAALGYREVRFMASTPLGPAATAVRGHEFHYSHLVAVPDVPAVYALEGRTGKLDSPEGFLRCNTLGSYVHLHFASNPAVAAHFVAAMAREARPKS